MGKPSRKAKVNIPGKVSCVITKEKSSDKLWKSCSLFTRSEKSTSNCSKFAELRLSFACLRLSSSGSPFLCITDKLLSCSAITTVNS